MLRCTKKDSFPPLLYKSRLFGRMANRRMRCIFGCVRLQVLIEVAQNTVHIEEGDEGAGILFL